MCLETVYRGNEKREAKKELPDVIVGYKVIDRHTNKTEYTDIDIKEGINCFASNSLARGEDRYIGGSHVFLNEMDATRWICDNSRLKVIKVYVAKKDINSIGRQGEFWSRGYTITVKKFTVKSLRGIE